MRVADLVHEGLKRGVTSTLRDLYYRDVPLFGRQQIVDGVRTPEPRSLHAPELIALPRSSLTISRRACMFVEAISISLQRRKGSSPALYDYILFMETSSKVVPR